MPTIYDQLANALTKFFTASDKAHTIINGDSNTTVETESGTLPSIAKFYADNPPEKGEPGSDANVNNINVNLAIAANRSATRTELQLGTLALQNGDFAALELAVNNLANILESDDTDLDELQEIVSFIKLNREDLDSLNISSIAGLTDALASKVNVNDVRLSDARTPLAHTHSVSEITGLGSLSTQNGTFSGTSSGTNTGDETQATIATLINASTTKAVAVDTDTLSFVDSVTSALRKLTFSNLWDYIKGKLDTNLTIAGSKTLSGQLQLTGQAATDANSAMTRGLADARYPQFVSDALTSQLEIVSDDTLTDRLSITIPSTGIWLVEAMAMMASTTSNGKMAFRAEGGSATGLNLGWLGWRQAGTSYVNNPTTPSGANRLDLTSTLNVTIAPRTIHLQIAQNVADSTASVFRPGCFIKATRLV
jgi:hypothetical protein